MRNSGSLLQVFANAQNAYLSLTNLRLQFEQQEQACLLLYAVALEEVRSLIAEAQLARQCEVDVLIDGVPLATKPLINKGYIEEVSEKEKMQREDEQNTEP